MNDRLTGTPLRGLSSLRLSAIRAWTGRNPRPANLKPVPDHPRACAHPVTCPFGGSHTQDEPPEGHLTRRPPRADTTRASAPRAHPEG
jgi:hypothetical protein